MQLDFTVLNFFPLNSFWVVFLHIKIPIEWCLFLLPIHLGWSMARRTRKKIVFIVKNFAMISFFSGRCKWTKMKGKHETQQMSQGKFILPSNSLMSSTNSIDDDDDDDISNINWLISAGCFSIKSILILPSVWHIYPPLVSPMNFESDSWKDS